METTNEIITIDKETMERMIDDAHKYIYNLLDFEGEYTKEKFQQAFEKMKEEKGTDIFTNADVMTKEVDYTTVMQGYGLFGNVFIKAMIDKDPASAYHVFENVVQDWLDIQEFLKEVTEKLERENNKLKAEKEMKENS